MMKVQYLFPSVLIALILWAGYVALNDDHLYEIKQGSASDSEYFENIAADLTFKERKSIYKASHSIYEMMRKDQECGDFEASKTTSFSDYMYQMGGGKTYLFLSYFEVLRDSPYKHRLENALERDAITFVDFGLLMDHLRKAVHPAVTASESTKNG